MIKANATCNQASFIVATCFSHVLLDPPRMVIVKDAAKRKLNETANQCGHNASCNLRHFKTQHVNTA